MQKIACSFCLQVWYPAGRRRPSFPHVRKRSGLVVDPPFFSGSAHGTKPGFEREKVFKVNESPFESKNLFPYVPVCLATGGPFVSFGRSKEI